MSDHKNLAAALVAIQQERPTLLKNVQGHNYKYANLDQTLDLLMPVIAKHGVAWMTKPTTDGNGKPALHYRAVHAASGEVEADTMPLFVGKGDMQGYGSALTYARRYAVQAVFNLAAEDDDGRATMYTPPPEPQPELLRDDLVAELVATKKKAAVEQEWLRTVLVGAGASDVPAGDVTLATIKRLSESQAMDVLDALNAEIERKAAQ
jgi:hypothetical protein